MNKILVIDDVLMVRRAVKELIQSDYVVEIEEAISGFQAIEKLKTNKYKLIICDVKMLDGDGIDVFRFVNQFQPELKKSLVYFSSDLHSLQLNKVDCYRIIDKSDIEGLIRTVGEFNFLAVSHAKEI